MWHCVCRAAHCDSFRSPPCLLQNPTASTPTRTWLHLHLSSYSLLNVLLSSRTRFGCGLFLSFSAMGLCGLRTKYAVKQYLILAMIIVDLALNTVIDSKSSKVSVVAMMVVQGVMRILALFTMFLFMWETFVFKYGLLGALCQRFKLMFIIWPISFALLLAVRIYRGVRRRGGGETPDG